MNRIRLALWGLVALVLVALAALVLLKNSPDAAGQTGSARSTFGGPFILVGSDAKPFSSQALEGKPYVIYFGFTRCGNACPTTLSRLVKLRREAAIIAARRLVPPGAGIAVNVDARDHACVGGTLPELRTGWCDPDDGSEQHYGAKNGAATHFHFFEEIPLSLPAM